jgi:NDP-sugar pyrophosphorylase family protein
MKPTLLILAAGMASRYGSMKQIQGFGPDGETIMDYSIYDAIRAGFGKVVFIIRKEFAGGFKEIFEPKLKGRIETDYVFQEMDDFVDKNVAVVERAKPWGTAHAVLCAKDAISEPYAVINADDFYGQDAFVKAAEFLQTECSPELQALIGYQLIKTLSEHGTVSRGVCQVDENGYLVSIKERTKTSMQDGVIVDEGEGKRVEIQLDSKVSMNFWCFHPSIFGVIENEFRKFVLDNKENPKAEFFIPIVADEYSRSGAGRIKVITTTSQWFGVTYKEDAPVVEKSLNTLVQKGDYPPSLWR